MKLIRGYFCNDLDMVNGWSSLRSTNLNLSFITRGTWTFAVSGVRDIAKILHRGLRSIIIMSTQHSVDDTLAGT